MKQYRIAFLIVLNLTACTTASRVSSFDNADMYLIACNGLSVPLLKCFEKAKEKCPDGYYLVDQSSGNIAFSGGVYIEGEKKSVLVRCTAQQKDTVIK